MKSKYGDLIFDWVKIIVTALVLAVIIRTFITSPRWIPSESMLPTLKVGDYLLIDKLVYKFQGLDRGDIVVFSAPPAAHKEDDLIKRVIGLPGEEVSVKDGIVYINNQPLAEDYILEKPAQDYKPFKIPDDCVFVMGDNRNESYDSRYWGPLPIKNIIGKAVFRYYPLSELGILK